MGMECAGMAEVVCVTGGSGFIGSWVVRLLLERGYSVRATVQNLGCTEGYENFYMGCVHVKDVAKGHILLYETPSASGRHLCVEAITHWSDFAEMVGKLYPEYKVHRFTEVTQPGLLRVENASKKLIELGLAFEPMGNVIRDSISTLKERGFLN